jgi:ComF family protein
MSGHDWTLTLKNLFLPIFCRECGVALLTEENGFFCPRCWSKPERIERPYCTGCGRPHRERIGFGITDNFLCAECRTTGPRPYRYAFAACDYDGAIAEAIKLLKFGDRPRLAGPLAEEAVRFIEREVNPSVYSAVVPVPLHRVRRRWRGFNQAELLAERLMPVFSAARLSGSLVRIRPTRAQSGLDDTASRRANVRGAFAVAPDASFKGQTVLLVDDVMTTGGTMAECARALKRAGAETVDVLAVAVPVKSMEVRVPAGELEASAVLRPQPVAAG